MPDPVTADDRQDGEMDTAPVTLIYLLGQGRILGNPVLADQDRTCNCKEIEGCPVANAESRANPF